MFTHNEKVDMLLIYGEAKKRRNVPERKMFSRLETILRQNEKSLLVTKMRQKTTTINQNIDVILNYFQTHRGTSIREASTDLNSRYNTIQRVLNANKYDDYKIHNLQELSARDFERRVNFICQFLVAVNDEPKIYNHILLTDESHFVSHVIPNRKNTHYWSNENPHNVRRIQRQGHFGIHVWCGIVGRYLVGPYEGALTRSKISGISRESTSKFTRKYTNSNQKTFVESIGWRSLP